MTTLDNVVIWHVWLYSSQVRVVAAENASMDEICKAAKVAMDDQKLRELDDHTERTEQLWLGRIAEAEIAKIERGSAAWLMAELTR